MFGEEIKALQKNEFACKPEVSPTAMYLEVVVGKNMSLVCTIEVNVHTIFSFDILYTFNALCTRINSSYICLYSKMEPHIDIVAMPSILITTLYICFE